jgi:hypothetical protein
VAGLFVSTPSSPISRVNIETWKATRLELLFSSRNTWADARPVGSKVAAIGVKVKACTQADQIRAASMAGIRILTIAT